MGRISAAQRWAERGRPRAEERAGEDLVARQLSWVLASRSGWQRFWLSIAAAWRCSRAAARRRRA